MPPLRLLPKKTLYLPLYHQVLTKPMASLSPSQHLNVLSRPLAVHSLSPPTGYNRDGYCHAPATDLGNHSIAAILTPQFLSFTRSRGNDLSSIGLTGGCRWCLCVFRWKEALDAFRRGEVGRETVPRVVVEATGVRALEGVRVGELQEWAAEENVDL